MSEPETGNVYHLDDYRKESDLQETLARRTGSCWTCEHLDPCGNACHADEDPATLDLGELDTGCEKWTAVKPT
jgi:radical SAM protein with 4Fe4S-binding SPASM domain